MEKHPGTTPTRNFVLGIIGALCAAGLWEVAGRTKALGDTLPPFSSCISAAVTLFGAPDYRDAVADTLGQWFLGLLISVIVAVPIGLTIGLNQALVRYTASTIDFLRSVPPVVLLPLFVLAFGTGWRTSLLLAVFGAAWPIMISSISGARGLDSLMLDTARVFQLKRLRRFVMVTLPACAPAIATGVRIGAAITLIVVVVVQLIGAVPGLGNFIGQSQLAGNFVNMYAAIIAVGVLGVAGNWALVRIEQRVIAAHGLGVS